jgi:carboxyl-terminal processing protease
MKKSLYLFIYLLVISIATQAQTHQQKMAVFLNLLDNYYVEDINTDSLVEVGIKHMLKQLDPHSVYFSKEEFKKTNEPLEGNFEGVGIQFQIYEDTLMVVHVIQGGPSQKVGIQDGDKIIYVDTSKIAGIGIDNDAVFKYLRGAKGTKVNVKIKRYGESELLDFEIIRDKIPIYAIEAQYMATPEIGYIKLSRFSANATEEVSNAIDILKRKGAKKLILDLTGNGGGYLNQAHALSDIFLPEGKLIVYSEGRSQPRIDLNSTEIGNFESGDVVVMVDQSSASASEIVAGAIQDWDRGLIIGRRTFGKGLVQKGYNLPDGAVVRLTMAHYYTPSGRNIQKPFEKGKEAYYEDLNDRYESGELFDVSKTMINDSTKFYTQNKRIVYAGGGVMPDIFVPIDTSWTSKFYSKLIRSGAFNQFALNFVDNNRQELMQKYTSESEFINKFEITESLYADFLELAKNKKTEPDSAEVYTNSIPTIKNQLKALIGQNLFNYNIYYQITNPQNPIYIKALDAFKDGSFVKFGIHNMPSTTNTQKINPKLKAKQKSKK